ncbi:MAG: glycosyltransferase [Bacteroidales bacterium]
MCLIEYLSVFFIVIYVFTIALLLCGWLRLKKSVAVQSGSYPYISVVVAVRNEEHYIARLLEDLLVQHYPQKSYEIIVIDDNSEDHTAEVVGKFCRQYPELIRLLPIAHDKKGKKHALDTGIKSAKGDLILTTDADCRVPLRWIGSYADFYISENKPKIITGLVDFEQRKGIFMALQNIEFLSLVGSGAGAAGIGKPVYCNAANLLFEKKVYLQIKDPLEHKAVSGDDTFLLHHVKKLFPDEIKMIKSPEAIVYTKPAVTLKEFLRQRIRWASKAKYYRDFDTLILGGVVLTINAATIGWFAGALFFGVKLFGWLVLIKCISDWLMISPVLSFFHRKKLHYFVPLLSVIYPFYIVTTSIFSLFAKVEWKDRIYSKN